MTKGVNLILCLAAVYRMTRMVVRRERGPFDVIENATMRIELNFEEDHWLHEGSRCWHCVGFWFALLFSFLPSWLVTPFGVAGLLSLLLDVKDELFTS